MSAVPGITYFLDKSGVWTAPGRPSLLPTVPTFVVGTTYPDATTVGAGILRPLTSVVNSDVTYVSGTYVDTTFNGIVNAKPGVVFENCAFRGPVVRTSGSNLLNVVQYAGLGSAQVLARYCDINPQTPSPYWNGVGYRNYRLEQCDVWGNTDNLAAFSLSTDADPAIYIDVVGTWLHDMSQFHPDTASGRAVTHNDCIQLQGNIGAADDVLIDGCRLDGTASTSQSSPLPPTHEQLSAVMVTPATRDRVCLTVKRSWLSGGIDTFNATKTGQPNTVLVLDQNVWEKPHPSTNGPSIAIALSSAIASVSVTNQLYTDGTAVVPVMSA